MKLRHVDPRCYQIVALSALIFFGLWVLEWRFQWLVVASVFFGAYVTQLAGTRWRGDQFDPWSALISILSLCLLLRTHTPWIGLLAGMLAIGSKFVIVYRGKHFFNPTNFALLVCIGVLGEAWITPGQWGNSMQLALVLAGAGLLVITRARRLDVTAVFLGCYALAVSGRGIWLGDAFAIAMHQMQSGALLIFAFFMISDPRSTPDSRIGRTLFAAVAAFAAFYFQFWWFSPNGLVYGLAIAAVLTPVLDRYFPGARYQWTREEQAAALARSGVAMLPSAPLTARPKPNITTHAVSSRR